MKRLKLLMVLLPLTFLGLARGEDTPPVEATYVDSDRVFIKIPQWHLQDDGSWLFTCRLETGSERFVSPIAHLHFYKLEENEDENAEKVILWEHKAIVRRRSFERNYGSGKGSFERVLFKNLPKDLERMTVEFVNEPMTRSEN